MRTLALALVVASLPAAADRSVPAPVDASSLLARWLDAQNRGDFDAYGRLYARGFHGVRRSGDRAVALDRAGWLRDRERMFKRPMVVGASDVQVSPWRDGAGVTFTQTFASGGYRDSGRKVIEAIVEDGAPRILYEELLASQLDEELLLLRALYPGYRPADRRIAPDGDTRVAAFQWRPREDGGAAVLVQLREGDDATVTEVELALFERQGARRRVLARECFGADGREWQLRPRELPVARGDHAVEVLDDEDEKSGDGWKTWLRLWRRDGDRLVQVFAAAIDEDGPACECFPIDHSEVTTVRRGDAWDVVEDVTANANQCHGRARHRRVVHRWDGAAYR